MRALEAALTWLSQLVGQGGATPGKEFVMLVVIFMVLLPIMLIVPIVGKRLFSRDQIDPYLAVRLCPACGFSLAGRFAEDDGCVVCSECGGAWRIPAFAIADSVPTPAA
jgi:cyanate permease